MTWWQLILNNWVFILLGTLVLPGIFGWVISSAVNQINLRLVNAFGDHAEVYFGFFGIIIREASHTLMAILFGHQIQDFKLIQFPKDRQIGYVKHTHNPNSWWQSLGNLLIGYAPIFGITLIMWLITWLLVPELTTVFTQPVLGGFYSSWQFWVWLLLMINLALGFNLSRADFKNSLMGMKPYLILSFIVTIIYSLITHTQLTWQSLVQFTILNNVSLVLLALVGILWLLSLGLLKLNKKY